MRKKIDHTVQLGAEKCLVILGIRLCNLPAPGSCLSQEDVEPIALFPVRQSSGAVVFQQNMLTFFDEQQTNASSEFDPEQLEKKTKKVRAQLLAFVAEESLKANPNERLLGSSEVIESVFLLWCKF